MIFGSRRAGYQTPSGEALRTVSAWAQGELSELTPGRGEYRVPSSPLRGRHGAAFRFQYTPVTDDDYLRAADAAAARLDAGREMRALVPPVEPAVIRPAMSPKKGHIALQLSGGLLGTNAVSTPAGGRLLLKGNVRKYTVLARTGEELDPDARADDGREGLRRVEVEERFETLLSTLDEAGTLETHTDPARIGELLEQYVEQLAAIVQARNVPAYMRPEPWEWSVFDGLSQGRRLPGLDRAGLTDFQRHLAIANGRLCLAHGAGLLTAEMGAGKTTVGLAIAGTLVRKMARGKRSTCSR